MIRDVYCLGEYKRCKTAAHSGSLTKSLLNGGSRVTKANIISTVKMSIITNIAVAGDTGGRFNLINISYVMKSYTLLI